MVVSINVAEFLAESALHRPMRCAWRFGSREATYAELAVRAEAVADGLIRRGVVRGDRVVIDLPNGPELIETLFGCFWAGLVAVPINWHLTPDEVAYIVDHCQARAAIVAGERIVDELQRCAANASGPRLVVEVARPRDVDRRALSYAELAGGGDTSAGHPAAMDGEDAAWLFYTSGTTGRPKGAVLTHRNLRSMTSNYLSDVDPVDSDAVYLHAAPLTHGSGLYLLPATARGATHVVLDAPRFTAHAYLTAVDRHSVTHGAFLAPTMLKRLVDGGNPSDLNLSSLRSIVVGGAPLYTRDIDDAHRMFGNIVTQIYGQGEAPMTITVMRAGDAAASSRSGSTGRAFNTVSVEVRDAHGGAVAEGVAGEVCVRGEVVMDRYWNDPDATAAALRDGWLHTGDVGYLDPEGFLFLTDRIKDVIITGGSNVYPREVEEVLLRHPYVAEVSVFGIPDPEWGESICAVVVPVERAVLSELDLMGHCQNHLASFKKPRRLVIASSLPKNAAGKVLKRELRTMALD